MRIVSTFHPPSSVVASLKCRLSPNSQLEYLVVAKPDRLDVFSIQEEGLKHECGLDIWGRISSVKELPRSASSYSYVTVLTDHPDPRLITLSLSTSDSGQSQLIATSSLSLSERTGRHAEFFNDVLVHPGGQVAVASCYAGKLKVVVFDNGQYKRDFDAQVPELNVLSMCFLPTAPDIYCLAILAFDCEQRIQLLSRDLSISMSDFELSPVPSTLLPGTALSSSAFPSDSPCPLLVPILSDQSCLADMGDKSDDAFRGGVLVVGGRKVQYFELASQHIQDKHKGKRRRLETRKKSGDKTESAKAKEKERARESKKRKPKASVEWPWSEVTAWCHMDEQGKRVILGDSFGRLVLLSVNVKESHVLTLLPLGKTSSPTCLTHLTDGIVYLGSMFGDSQILRIRSCPISVLESATVPIPDYIHSVSPESLVSTAKQKGNAALTSSEGIGVIVAAKGGYLEELQAFQNIAPIMDAILTDIDGSAQPTIITCSGGRNTGALKVIRNGADFHEVAVVAGLPHIINIWPLRSRFQDSIDTHLLVSTPSETHIFQMNGGDTFARLEPSVAGFVTDTRTLAVSNVSRRTPRGAGQIGSSYSDSSCVVQVTPKKVILSEFDDALGLFSAVHEEWSPENLSLVSPNLKYREIIAASINASQVVLALNGGKLVLLNLDDHNHFNLVKHKDFHHGSSGTTEISAVSCTPMDPSKNYSSHVAVSLWDSNEVQVLSLTSSESFLNPICMTGNLPSLPRSLLFFNFGTGSKSGDSDYRPHLLIGLADGTIMSFIFKDNELKDGKSFSLGSGPVSLTPCKVDGKRCVFACASRSSILFWEKERLKQSPMLLKDVVTLSRLNTTHYPSSLALATSTGISIGSIGHLDKMHIRSIPFGSNNPFRIVHHPAAKLFGVACIRKEPTRIGDSEATQSFVRLMDDATFNYISEFECDSEEEITSLEIYDTRSPDILLPCFCVGTTSHQDEREPSRGRLLILTADTAHDDKPASSSEGKLSLAASAQVNGCVYALANVNGMIAAAVNTSVVLFRLKKSQNSLVLERISEWNNSYVLTSLVACEDRLVVGDAINSVSVLEVKDAQLRNYAKDYSALWPVAVQAMDGGSVIVANSDFNLFTFTLQVERGRNILHRDGGYHLADLVNKFIPGTLTGNEYSGDVPIEPKQLFFTSSGRIGVVFDMESELSLHMTGLERNMAGNICGAGGVRHTEWRAPVSSGTRADSQITSYGFVDGDFLEQFLSFSPTSQIITDILSGTIEAETLKLSYAQIQHVLEKLQSMH